LAVLVALTVSVVAFLLLNFATDPARSIAGDEADAAMIEAIRKEYGFDRPLPVRYGEWLLALVQGDFGQSHYWGMPIADLIFRAAPPTLVLAIAGVLITIAIALPLGTFAALRPNTWIDRFCLGFAVS